MFENSEHGPQAFADVQKWHAMLAAAIHENSSKMVTTGSAAPKWNSPIYDNWGEYEGNIFSDEALSATINNANAYLDFYQYHWYPWQSQYMQSPFTKTTDEYQVDDRPVIVGESEGNDVCDQYVCQTVTEMYESAYTNGFDGVCAWKTPKNDGHGTFENIAVATNAFYKNHPDLVYPIGSDPVPVTGITLSESSISIQERNTHKLTATLIPSNASDKRMSWSTADASVATVVNGTVTGVAPGNTTVTVTTNDGGFTAQSSVEVTERTAICENPLAITLPFDKDGAGVFCFVTSANIDHVNAWNLEILEINGVNVTNTYTNSMPPREDGKYYIYYEGNFAHSHLEVRGSGGAVTQKNLTTSFVGQGSVTPASGTYDAGTVVNLTAIPAQGWEFSQWSGDASGSSATTSVTMDADKSIIATFTEIVDPVDYKLTLSATGQGSITLDPAGGTYTEGTVVNLTASPAAGYQFDNWSGNLIGSINPTSITMNTNKSVTANFVVATTTVCDNPVAVTIPFTKDGAGDFCWSTTREPSYINSWNLAELTINGVDFTNSWSNHMPPVENGKWIIHYVGNHAWSHFEIPE